MCSVVGYVGKNLSRSFVMEGLSRLEYRGYDTAGFACLDPKDHGLLYAKSAHGLQDLFQKLETHPIDGFLSIGHTRWSTHGAPSHNNAHPQFDCVRAISVVHNGIIENYHVLKKQLLTAEHVFTSETDTEIIAHLLEDLFAKHTTFHGAAVDLVNRLEGAYAFVALAQQYSDTLLLVRKRAPLCIGIGDDEVFVASDPVAFAGKTSNVVYMPDESFAIVTQKTVLLYDFAGKPLPLDIKEEHIIWTGHEKRGHEHFMLKEIHEQRNAIQSTVRFLQSMGDRVWDCVGITSEQVKNLESLQLIGCGTSWHAARIGQFFFEAICAMPTRVSLASELRVMPFFKQQKTAYIAISQSGETADTLEALRLVQTAGQPTIALTNSASSTMVREADGFLLTQAGYEVAVASTKAFSTQITALYWLAHRMALERGLIDVSQLMQAEQDLFVAAQILENSIENYKHDIRTRLAPQYAQVKRSIFLGRHISYPFSMEAALKLKEISYIFAQCYPGGELKHGPLALVDAQTPIFLFSHADEAIYKKLLSDAQEVKARGGHLVVFAFEGQEELCALADLTFLFPPVKTLLGPLVMTGVMQFFVYEIARVLGRPIDKPRNLAKSVTVG